MRRSWIVGAMTALMLVVVPAAGYLQAASDVPKEGKSVEGKDCSKDRRASYYEKLGAKLGVDQAAVDKLKSSFEQHKGERRATFKERKALQAKLQEAVEKGSTDAQIEAIFKEIDAQRAKDSQLRADHQAELKEILGTQGYAKYVLFKKDFRRHAWSKMRWRHHRPGPDSRAPSATGQIPG